MVIMASVWLLLCSEALCFVCLGQASGMERVSACCEKRRRERCVILIVFLKTITSTVPFLYHASSSIHSSPCPSHPLMMLHYSLFPLTFIHFYPLHYTLHPFTYYKVLCISIRSFQFGNEGI